MKITHDVRPQGHFITIEYATRSLTVRTENGTAQELEKEACEMLLKANALIRRAGIIKEALSCL